MDRINQFNELSSEERHLKSGIRRSWVMVDRDLQLNDEVYLPLYDDIEAISATTILLDTAARFGCAVYRRNRYRYGESKYNWYEYIGDKLR